jgi:hypothetical protein
MAEESANDGELERRPRGRIGRPSKLTPETKEKILTAVKCGAPFKTACAAAGICEATFYAWKQKGETQGTPPEYAEFLEELTQALEEGNAARAALIMRAAKTDWRAAGWLLERLDPERWSVRYKVEHSAAPVSIADALLALRRRQAELEIRDAPPLIEAPGEQGEE